MADPTPSNAIWPQRVNHMNVVLRDFAASIAHFRTLYDAEFMADMPQKDVHAGLFAIGRVIFEPFVPHAYLTSARYGPHYVGIEYQANMERVREAVAAHKIGVIRDIGLALHTDPADCFGIAFEFYEGYFHDREWEPLGGQMKPAEYWRDDHALGLTGLKAYTVAVHDIEEAKTFVQSFLGGEVVHDEMRAESASRAVGLQVADSILELVTPVGDGMMQQHLNRFGEGIRSTVFGVRDLEQAKRYFTQRNVRLSPGAAPNSFAVPTDANLGLIFEFVE